MLGLIFIGIITQLNLPEHLSRQFDKGYRLRKQGYRGRFAPTPSGLMHLGNIRTALVSWLKARIESGTWLLRVDDLDSNRIRSGAIESFKSDLLWLGLQWDGPIVFQSQRRGLYNSVLSSLRRDGRLYPCRCSRKLLSRLPQELVPQAIYPGTCRNSKLSWGIEDGKLPSWRLLVNKEYADLSGDVVVRRSDGFIGYHLATVIDEITLGISEVIRGDDLRTAIPSQLAIFDSIDISQPVSYRHAPLMLDNNGCKLSKRSGHLGLERLKQEGLSPFKAVGLLSESLNLVPKGAELSVSELLSELRRRPDTLDNILNKNGSRKKV